MARRVGKPRSYKGLRSEQYENTLPHMRPEINRARLMRGQMSDVEVILWSRLKRLRERGFHMRRQAPFRGYFLDFVCYQRRVAIEVDGRQHADDIQADHDRVLLWAADGRLDGRAPDVLAGQIEVRGLGIVTAPARRFCEVCLLVRAGVADRMPEPATQTVLGVSTQLLKVAPFEVSAPIRLGLALTAFDAAHKRRI